MNRFDHVAAVVAGVVAAAARDAGRARLVVLGHAAPESALLLRLLAAGGSGLPVELIGAPDDDRESVRAEARRRAGKDGLLLDPVNKTVALLWPDLLAEPVLPLADLFATQVASLGDGWSAPAQASALIERAGGVEAVDRFLVAHIDERRPLDAALAHLDPAAAGELRARLATGWWWRRRVGVVPKLGTRTLGIDLR